MHISKVKIGCDLPRRPDSPRLIFRSTGEINSEVDCGISGPLEFKHAVPAEVIMNQFPAAAARIFGSQTFLSGNLDSQGEIDENQLWLVL
jgi:hypothetical protein